MDTVLATLLSHLGRIAAVLSTTPGLGSGHDGVLLYLKDATGASLEDVIADDDFFLSWRLTWKPEAGPEGKRYELAVFFRVTDMQQDSRPDRFMPESIFCDCRHCRDVRCYPDLAALCHSLTDRCAGNPPEVMALPQFKSR